MLHRTSSQLLRAVLVLASMACSSSGSPGTTTGAGGSASGQAGALAGAGGSSSSMGGAGGAGGAPVASAGASGQPSSAGASGAIAVPGDADASQPSMMALDSGPEAAMPREGGRSDGPAITAPSGDGAVEASRAADAGGDGGTDLHPLLAVLPQFVAPGVPVRGPMESPPTPKTWAAPAVLPVRTGMGIAQHPMLYVGENYNRISVVNEGRVVWTYDTAPGFELDDVWMMSNGHILYTHMTFIEEITPDKQVVWHRNAPAGSEIHSCQPIGLDKVLFVQNGQPPRVIVLDKRTGVLEVDHSLETSTDVHGQFRRIRTTAAGSYILSYLSAGKVVEYDKTFNIIWSYNTPKPWSAVRLRNGNTLVQDETQSAAKEVNAAGQVVWQLTKADFALPAGAGMGNTQSCERLSSGNTVMFGNGGVNPNNIQAVEVTPAKQVVWMLQDWIHLGDATSAQFLDEPGLPEVPGETEH